MRGSVGRRLVAAVAACATLGGCYYPPGYYGAGYGYGYPPPVVGATPGTVQPQGGDSDGTAASPPGYIQQGDAAQGYAPGYGYAPGAGYATQGFVAPAYAPGYAYAPDYTGAAVAGLAYGALAGVAIASACCYGGWGWGRGWGGGWHGGYGRGGWGGWGWRGGGWHR